MSFSVEFLKEAEKFIGSLDDKTRNKVLYNIRKSQEVKDAELFKKLNTNIWEFRTHYKGSRIRLFAFWSKEDSVLVVCTHGIDKKTNKTPIKEIKKAEQIRKMYLNL